MTKKYGKPRKYDICLVNKKTGKIIEILKTVSIHPHEAEEQSFDWKDTGIKLIEQK